MAETCCWFFIKVQTWRRQLLPGSLSTMARSKLTARASPAQRPHTSTMQWIEGLAASERCVFQMAFQAARERIERREVD
jgi:hypothetical protein